MDYFSNLCTCWHICALCTHIVPLCAVRIDEIWGLLRNPQLLWHLRAMGWGEGRGGWQKRRGGGGGGGRWRELTLAMPQRHARINRVTADFVEKAKKERKKKTKKGAKDPLALCLVLGITHNATRRRKSCNGRQGADTSKLPTAAAALEIIHFMILLARR